MSEANTVCPECNRKIMQNISNRCMYCGASLPEEHHLSDEEKSELLVSKLQRMKEIEENADDIISGMRKDFGLPEQKKSRKQRKEDNSEALASALASINSTKTNDDSK